MTDASRDEKLVNLIETHGLMAYARFWRIVEVVAEQMDETGRCHATYSWAYWMRVTRTSNRSQCRRTLDALAAHSLLTVSETGVQATCSVPNLLKLREWTHKRAPKLSATEVEVEVEVEVDNNNTRVLSTFKYSSDFESFWNLYPRKIGKGGAWQVWKRLAPNVELKLKISLALATQKKSDQWMAENGRFIPHPKTWLNQARWDDEQTKALTFEEKIRERILHAT